MSNTKPSSVSEGPGASPQILRDGKSSRSSDPAVESLNVLESNCLMPQPKHNQRLRCCAPTPASRSCPPKSYVRGASAILGPRAPYLSPELSGQGSPNRIYYLVPHRHPMRPRIPLLTQRYIPSAEAAVAVSRAVTRHRKLRGCVLPYATVCYPDPSDCTLTRSAQFKTDRLHKAPLADAREYLRVTKAAKNPR